MSAPEPSLTLPEVRSSEVCFTGAKFRVERRRLAGPDGRERIRDVVVHPGAVVVLPVLPDGRVLFIHNVRPSVGQVLLELPAGTREPNEPPEVTAGRELVEETGYRAARLRLLGEFYTSPGVLSERMLAYEADGLTYVGRDLQDDEAITSAPMPLAEALALAGQGRIQDGKTLATLLLYTLHRGWVHAPT